MKDSISKDLAQYVHPYRSHTTTTSLPQCYDEKSEPQSKIDVHKVFDESCTSGCPIVFAETRSQTLIEMPREAATSTDSLAVQLFDEFPQRELPGRYTNAFFVNRGSNQRQIEIETLEGTEYLSLDKVLIGNGDDIPTSEIPMDKVIFDVEHGKSTEEFSGHNILYQFPFNYGVNSFTVVVHKTVTNLCVWDPDEMVVMESKVDDTYSDVNRVFDDSSQGAVSRELQPIAPLHVIRLFKLFRFLQQLLTQLIFVLQALNSKVWYAAIEGDFSFRKKITEQASALKMVVGKEVTKTSYIAWLHGCIKSMADLIEQELHNFSIPAELKGLVGTQGIPISYVTNFGLEFEFILVGYGADEYIILIMYYILDLADTIIVCPPTFSLYEVVALQTCENAHGSFYVIESELELVKIPSTVAAYVIHTAMISESKNFSVLVSTGKFKTMMRLMCYLAHLGGHRRVEECTVAQ
ncbi:hypothetical protein CQW23_18456 [Capsicum baccatum]|uniref:Uncharacterized protein n=1 Tax=Capsicum baccatum TaxID=33114 RepID=A0A2G2W2Y8_CAPBA|nr:hypothetical protein CQW23_18456 [Capsicum baccatum]